MLKQKRRRQNNTKWIDHNSNEKQTRAQTHTHTHTQLIQYSGRHIRNKYEISKLLKQQIEFICSLIFVFKKLGLLSLHIDLLFMTLHHLYILPNPSLFFLYLDKSTVHAHLFKALNRNGAQCNRKQTATNHNRHMQNALQHVDMTGCTTICICISYLIHLNFIP